jgi:hypothetical protein
MEQAWARYEFRCPGCDAELTLRDYPSPPPLMIDGKQYAVTFELLTTVGA